MQSRKAPTLIIDVLGKPDAIPENRIGDFTESLQQNDFFIKAPVWDTIGEGLEEFYVTARVEHHVMMREKATLMEHQDMQGRANENRLQELKQSQDELQERFIKTNVFLREFEEKRSAAMKRGTAELALHRAIRTQNVDIRHLLDEFGEFRSILLDTAAEYEPYERVLNDVVTKLHAFNSVKDLMDRCDALMLVQVEINELGDKKIMELESMRKRLVAISREAALQVLGLKNALSSVDRLYEAARSESFKWERTLQRVKKTVNEGYCNRDRVLEGVNHLYRLLCQRRSVLVELPHDAVEQRMEFIKDEVELLREVLEACQKPGSEAVANKMELMC